MSLLTIIGLLPLVISVLIVAIPGKNIGLIKKVAFAGTTIIAIISIFLAIGFDKSDTSIQYVQSNAWIPPGNSSVDRLAHKDFTIAEVDVVVIDVTHKQVPQVIIGE